MITLITGSPGAGKTAAMVAMLLDLAKTRSIYAHGVDQLQVPHVDVDAAQWHEVVPDGAVLVVDEAQRVWRARGPSQRPPDSVVELETHRHRGVDVILTTQQPRLVDAGVRALVGRHIHLRSVPYLGRWWYEWPECMDQCLVAWKSAPIKHRYRLPRRTFDQYVSATEHTQAPRGFPRMLAVAVLAFVGAGALGWYAVHRVSARVHASEAVEVGAPRSDAGAAVSASATPLVQSQSAAIDDRTAWVPRVSSRPESAPAYDRLREVIAMPVVAGAACTARRCKCYTQQGTDAGLSDGDCRRWLDSPPFDPYRSADPGKGAPQAQPLPADAQSAAQDVPAGRDSVLSFAAPAF